MRQGRSGTVIVTLRRDVFFLIVADDRPQLSRGARISVFGDVQQNALYCQGTEPGIAIARYRGSLTTVTTSMVDGDPTLASIHRRPLCSANDRELAWR